MKKVLGKKTKAAPKATTKLTANETREEDAFNLSEMRQRVAQGVDDVVRSFRGNWRSLFKTDKDADLCALFLMKRYIALCEKEIEAA